MAFEHQHDPVALFDALRLEEGGSAGGHLAHLAERESAFFSGDVAPDHCPAVRLISEYGSVEAALDAADTQLKGKLRERMLDGR